MKPRLFSRVAFLILLASQIQLARQVRFEVPASSTGQWYKGNTHTHTRNSDGDSSPDSVARWYQSHGYRFLVLSDHNMLTDPASIAWAADSGMLLIPGEEVTSSFARKPVHLIAINIPRAVPAVKDSTLIGTLQKNVDNVRAAGGLPSINHPNFGWAFDHETLRHLTNAPLFEIFNGHPLVNNAGGGGKPSVEAMWDSLLTAGVRIYGMAVDDSHHLKEEFARHRANPGRAWVCVRADTLEARAVTRSLESGRFYASTGVELADLRITASTVAIEARQQSDFKYVIEFIGDGGRVLKRVEDRKAEFSLNLPQTYLRARVRDSAGFVAWVQPVFVEAGTK